MKIITDTHLTFDLYGLLMACRIESGYAPKFRPTFLDAEPALLEQEERE